jgi:predicted phosphodiesterase
VRRAIISDIHGNLDSLEAVLADIEHQRVDQIVCLGDIIGYGPNPRECLDRAMTFDQCILGNHDQGALFDPEGFSNTAEQAIFWTRSQLESGPNGGDNGDAEAAQRRAKRWEFLCLLPRTRRDDPFLFVHGSARNPLNEYVFPEDVYNKPKLDKIFGMIPQYCFQGHTHVPGVFTASGTFLSPDDLVNGYRLGDQKVMVNVGSVGQPRDGDSRACYVLLCDETVSFRRVTYPVERTVAKIHAIPELDNFLGDRLLEGR